MIREFKNIGVIGGGNIGTQFACMCSYKGYKTSLFTSRPDEFLKKINIINENGKTITGELTLVTDNLGKILENCDLIFITYPAFLLTKLANDILSYKNCISLQRTFVVLPGTGGVEFSFRKIIENGAAVYGVQRVPSVARLEKYGQIVRCEGLRKELNLASVSKNNDHKVGQLLEELWEIPCKYLPNYLNITLTPSNPILHTSRLYALFHNFSSETVYDKNPLFYGDWNDESSELLLKLDDELQMICNSLYPLDLSGVRSLKEHYESYTVADLTKKLSTIPSLHKIYSPMSRLRNGWVPNFNSRYFLADFPFGLSIFFEISKLLKLDCVYMRLLMNWYNDIIGNKQYFELSKYEIHTKKDLIEMYL